MPLPYPWASLPTRSDSCSTCKGKPARPSLPFVGRRFMYCVSLACCTSCLHYPAGAGQHYVCQWIPVLPVGHWQMVSNHMSCQRLCVGLHRLLHCLARHSLACYKQEQIEPPRSGTESALVVVAQHRPAAVCLVTAGNLRIRWHSRPVAVPCTLSEAAQQCSIEMEVPEAGPTQSIL